MVNLLGYPLFSKGNNSAGNVASAYLLEGIKRAKRNAEATPHHRLTGGVYGRTTALLLGLTLDNNHADII